MSKTPAESPLSYMRPEYVMRLLNLNSVSVLQGLLATPVLRQQIDARLLERLGPEPQFDGAQDDLLQQIYRMSDSDRAEQGRLLAVLSQATMLTTTTNGKTLAAVAGFYGGRALLKALRGKLPPKLSFVPTLEDLSEADLLKLTRYFQGVMVGVLPQNAALRLACQVAKEDFPAPIPMETPDAVTDFAEFFRAAQGYRAMIAQMDDDDETHQAA